MNLESEVKPENVFCCADGSVLRNLHELSSKLKHIRPETYAHHVNAYRNDFYNWVRDCYGNERLAQRIASAKSSLHAARMLENKLKKTKKKSKKRKIASVTPVAVKRRKKKTVAKRKHAGHKQVRDKLRKVKKRSSKKIKSPKRLKKKKVGLRHIHKKIHGHIKRFARKYGLI